MICRVSSSSTSKHKYVVFFRVNYWEAFRQLFMMQPPSMMRIAPKREFAVHRDMSLQCVREHVHWPNEPRIPRVCVEHANDNTGDDFVYPGVDGRAWARISIKPFNLRCLFKKHWLAAGVSQKHASLGPLNPEQSLHTSDSLSVWSFLVHDLDLPGQINVFLICMICMICMI